MLDFHCKRFLRHVSSQHWRATSESVLDDASRTRTRRSWRRRARPQRFHTSLALSQQAHHNSHLRLVFQNTIKRLLSEHIVILVRLEVNGILNFLVRLEQWKFSLYDFAGVRCACIHVLTYVCVRVFGYTLRCILTGSC